MALEDALELADELTDYKAELTAETETALSAAEGERIAWGRMIEDGLLPETVEKMWVAQDDGRVCPECSDLDGKSVPVDHLFEGNNDEYDGPPAHPNCRCYPTLIEGADVGSRAEAAALQLLIETNWGERDDSGQFINEGGVIDSTDMKQVGGQKGSQPGGLFVDKAGQKWYVKKSQSDLHQSNELLTVALYKAAGINVPDLKPAILGGQKAVASRWVSGAEDVDGYGAAKIPGGKEGLAVDAWLANWDAIGNGEDNMVVKDNQIVRIDGGGGLLFRAQGKPKGPAFGDKVSEIDSLRDSQKNYHAAKVFGQMTRDEIDKSISLVERVSPDEIRRLVKQYMPESIREELTNRLLARRDDLIQRKSEKHEMFWGDRDEGGRLDWDDSSIVILSRPEKHWGERDDEGRFITEGGGGDNRIADEPTTKPSGKAFEPDVEHDADGDGVTDAARVGVPADEVPPPPDVPRLPNLTAEERAVESAFADAYEKDPDGMARAYLALVNGSPPPKFEADAAKNLFGPWAGTGLTADERAEVRSTMNTALHQTADAITKRAFLMHLDSMSDEDKAKGMLVTVGGCGAGKGFALKTLSKNGLPEFDAKNYGAVWDSAGDQNATENTWLLKEAESRGIHVTYAYVSADPEVSWADEKRGVVARAGDPNDGRMVDAHVFADSYVLGAKNHDAFSKANADKATFIFVANGGKIERLPGVPKSDLGRNRTKLREFAHATVEKLGTKLSPRIRRGATVGKRIWG